MICLLYESQYLSVLDVAQQVELELNLFYYKGFLPFEHRHRHLQKYIKK